MAAMAEAHRESKGILQTLSAFVRNMRRCLVRYPLLVDRISSDKQLDEKYACEYEGKR